MSQVSSEIVFELKQAVLTNFLGSDTVFRKMVLISQTAGFPTSSRVSFPSTISIYGLLWRGLKRAPRRLDLTFSITSSKKLVTSSTELCYYDSEQIPTRHSRDEWQRIRLVKNISDPGVAQYSVRSRWQSNRMLTINRTPCSRTILNAQ